MNKQRRLKIDAIRETLEGARILLEELQEEEQDYLEAIPESLQSSARAESANAAIDAMQEAVDNIEAACENIAESIEA